MLEIEKPKLECVELTENYGKFVVEPLERGFGTTLGNSMRRVLLSSLPGVAVTSVRIDGVLHEFSIIEGVKEDVTEIVLNLKELCCKLFSDGPKRLIIDAAGEGEVLAKDFLPDSDVLIINPDLHIATLDKGAKFHMEIMLEHGRGYVTVERNKRHDMPIGEIAHILNAIHAALLKRRSLYAHVLAAVLEIGQHPVESVEVPEDEDIDAAWAEPEAFAGCSSKGQQSPDQPQPIQIVRRTASTPQRGASA